KAPAAYQSFEAPLMVKKAAPPRLNTMNPAPVVISAMSMPAAQPNKTALAEIKIPEPITIKNEIKDTAFASNKTASNAIFSADPLVKKYAVSPTQKIAENKLANKPAEQAT